MRMGIQYAARVHSPSWSMQHALCNLECAFLLSKWLETVATTIQISPLQPDEADLLRMIRSMVDETDFPTLVTTDSSMEEAEQGHDIRRLAVHVTKLWAETFKVAHAFDMVTMIGDSLKIYADLLEQTIES